MVDMDAQVWQRPRCIKSSRSLHEQQIQIRVIYFLPFQVRKHVTWQLCYQCFYQRKKKKRKKRKSHYQNLNPHQLKPLQKSQKFLLLTEIYKLAFMSVIMELCCLYFTYSIVPQFSRDILHCQFTLGHQSKKKPLLTLDGK